MLVVGVSMSLMSGPTSHRPTPGKAGSMSLRRLMSSLKLVDAEYGDEEAVNTAHVVRRGAPTDVNCSYPMHETLQVTG